MSTLLTSTRWEAPCVSPPIAMPPKVDLLGVGVSATTYDEVENAIMAVAAPAAFGDRLLPRRPRGRFGKPRPGASSASQFLRDRHPRRPTRPLGNEFAPRHSIDRPRLRSRVDAPGLPAGGLGRHSDLPLRRHGRNAAQVGRQFGNHLSGSGNRRRGLAAVSPAFRRGR